MMGGRKAIITGAAQGIGAAIARVFVETGASVAILDRQIERAQSTAAELGSAAIALGVELADATDCARAVAEARNKLGGLDVLVNNAAPGRDRSTIGRIAEADWATHETIVLRAAATMVKAALPDLTASGRGSVINVSSITGSAVALEQCSWPYHVSKAGLDQLTRWLAVRCGSAGVRVNAVAPGLVDRDGGPKLTDNPTNKGIVEAVVPLQRAASAREIGNVVAFLASDLAGYITGQVLVVDGGLGLNEVFGASLRAVNAARTSGA